MKLISLLLVPATRENLEKTIEKSVDITFAKRYLANDLVDEILRYSGDECIRCWAMTKSLTYLFDDLKKGDEVLLTEKGTGRFTHYGVVINKMKNVAFGNALWPIVGKNPWENIYFLTNITRLNVDKRSLVQELGYAKNYHVPGHIKVRETVYNNLGSLSKYLNIPIL